MSSLVLRGIDKSFSGTPVLHGIDLAVADGEFIVFVGPSGCGKTTLLRCIAGLEEVSAGDILIDGSRVNAVPPAERGVAMVFQSYALYPQMTVAQNMGFPLRMAGKPRAEIDRAVREAAEVLQLAPLLERRPAQLSGGQRQRVAIGRAIVRRPGVFLFDEPLSNLDAGLRTQMRLEMARLHRELHATILHVTHDQSEAMTLADRIVVFNKGRIEQVGPPLTLYREPANVFVASFLGSPRINLLDGTLQQRDAERAVVAIDGAGDGALICRLADPAQAPPPGARVQVGVRPEHWSVARRSALPRGAGLPARIQFVEHLGDVAYLHATTPGGAALTARVGAETAWQANDEVVMAQPSGDALLFDLDGVRR